MTYPSSSTAGDTSNGTQRAAEELLKQLPPERVQRIRTLQEKVRELDDRGLLKRQEYVALSTVDFERRLFCQIEKSEVNNR